MKWIVFCGLIAAASPGLAQDQGIPAEFFEKLGDDLSRLQTPSQTNLRMELGDYKGGATNAFFERFKVTSDGAPIYPGATTERPPITNINIGQELLITGQTGDWYAVSGPNIQGWARAEDGVPVGFTYISEGAYVSPLSDMTARFAQFYNEYANDSHVRITGFSVNVGVPPSITVEFAVKE